MTKEIESPYMCCVGVEDEYQSGNVMPCEENAIWFNLDFRWACEKHKQEIAQPVYLYKGERHNGYRI